VNETERATPAPALAGELVEMTAKHPCYSAEAHGTHARMHLPVAPRCNIGCNYCNRKFDCVNESRPGVTSEVLTPEQSLVKFRRVKEAIPALSVVGIAGPGDALANWDVVRRSIELIKGDSPEMVFCLSTNGLLLPDYAQEIVDLGIKHVTVTVNAVDPAIGGKIYRHAQYQGQHYKRDAAAEVLLRNQIEGIKFLSSNGVLVKVNIVMLDGINDGHILEVVTAVRAAGAFMTNIMPLIPAPGSVFEDHPQTNMKQLQALRTQCESEMPQMRHCQQCRADAIGLLGEDRSLEFSEAPCAAAVAALPSGPLQTYRVAVTSKHGTLVDLHYGHAEQLRIHETDGVHSHLVEIRDVEKYCHGGDDCDEPEARRRASALGALVDCDAVLTMRIGYEARKRLEAAGVEVVESCTATEQGLLDVARHMARLVSEAEKVRAGRLV
jgi:nitrogen fixation protein NifB